MRPKLSDKQKLAIYNQHCFGEKIEDLAESYECSNATIYRCIREMRERHESGRDGEMAARSKIVAGDKANGRLQSTTDPHRFEGTCVIGGKKHSKTFTTVNARKATEMWEKWCRDLRDEAEFMDMVERKPKEEGFVPTDEPMAFEDFLEDEPKAVCGYPGDHIEEIQPIQPAPVPEIVVRPWRDIAEELQSKVTEMQQEVDFCKRLEEAVKAGEPVDLWGTEYRPASEVESLRSELEVAKRERIDFAEGYQLEMHNPVYVLWAKAEAPRLYGAYLTMEVALKEVDKLNEVAAFLGGGSVFEVEEVAWKG